MCLRRRRRAARGARCRRGRARRRATPRPRSAAAISGRLRTSTGKVSRNGRGSPPAPSTVVRATASGLLARASSSDGAIAEHRRHLANAVGERGLDVDGRRGQLARDVGGRFAQRDHQRRGDSRSGSGKMISTPSTRGLPAAILRTSRATSVRGHGHWPYGAEALLVDRDDARPAAADSCRGARRCSRVEDRAARSSARRRDRARAAPPARERAASASTRVRGAAPRIARHPAARPAAGARDLLRGQSRVRRRRR